MHFNVYNTVDNQLYMIVIHRHLLIVEPNKRIVVPTAKVISNKYQN
jgi:hypothetical protein